MIPARNRVGTELHPQGSSVPVLDERRAERWAVIVNPIPRKVVSRVAGVGVDTVKAWRKGRQLPQMDHLFNLARAFPEIRAWTLSELGVGDAEFIGPQAAIAAAALYQVMHDKGPGGDAFRAEMDKLKRGRP